MKLTALELVDVEFFLGLRASAANVNKKGQCQCQFNEFI